MKDRDIRPSFPHEGLAVSLSLMYGVAFLQQGFLQYLLAAVVDLIKWIPFEIEICRVRFPVIKAEKSSEIADADTVRRNFHK
jgi:hypothetical protein